MRLSTLALLIIVGAFMPPESRAADWNENRIAILYDAFGKPSSLKKDWGYSALIEYEGRESSSIPATTRSGSSTTLKPCKST
jgi:hypothetical protein